MRKELSIVFAGVDIGSATTKIVILDERENVTKFALRPSGFDQQQIAEQLLSDSLDEIGKTTKDINYIIATGYGRRAFTRADEVLPEIICHAKGTLALAPSVRTIIDIGGQDSKVIELDEQGDITKFEMNDKCAAGTGRFLEVLTERILNVPLEELGPLSLRSQNPCTLSSVCTVFAESEIISYLSGKRAKEDIIYGMNRAIAKRVISMGISGQINYQEPVVFSGGVAKNTGVVRAMEEILGKKVSTLDEPQISGALGAALYAAARYGK
jgi:predicted CoA-substrate-specific enzyme activase